MRDYATHKQLWSAESFSFFELAPAEQAPDADEFYRRLDPRHSQEIGCSM